MKYNQRNHALQVLHSQIPLRPTFGFSGLPTVLYTNYFHLNLDPRVVLHKYDLKYKLQGGDRDELPRRPRKRLFQLLLQEKVLQSHGSAVATDYVRQGKTPSYLTKLTPSSHSE